MYKFLRSTNAGRGPTGRVAPRGGPQAFSGDLGWCTKGVHRGRGGILPQSTPPSVQDPLKLLVCMHLRTYCQTSPIILNIAISLAKIPICGMYCISRRNSSNFSQNVWAYRGADFLKKSILRPLILASLEVQQ